MTHMRTRVLALQGLLVLGAGGCHAREVQEVPPSEALQSAPREQPKQIPVAEPMPKPTAPPTPTPAPAPIVNWQPLAKPDWLRDRLLDSTANTARHSLENDRLGYQLNLHVHEESVTLTLTERESGHVLVHEWPIQLYEPDLEHEVQVALGELARDGGRTLLHLWVSHRLGEDIVFTSSMELVVLADADRLSTLWSGRTSKHASHVCGNWQDIELEFEPGELVITEYDRAEIFLPDEIPGYDCDENSREYETVRARHRVKLP
jgi:hypothetical protein